VAAIVDVPMVYIASTLGRGHSAALNSRYLCCNTYKFSCYCKSTLSTFIRPRA
jgi:hypothetical protein